ncbi:MAG: hypothetical protein HQK65_08090 [Desulfamplus sp.]|nr:hypothetical protein [Desulfamplus sp.]
MKKVFKYSGVSIKQQLQQQSLCSTIFFPAFKRDILVKSDILEIKSDSLKIWNINRGLLSILLIFLLLLFSSPVQDAWAISGQELEKPKPVFTRIGDEISAKYIPRAKSTSVTTTFKVTKGGKLVEVKGMDFEKAERPEVDIKNYKSALFIIEIGDVIPAGSEATVTVSSDFFASGTEYRVFNEKLPQPWFNSECQNISTKDRVRDLIVTIKDGGPFDSDGEADGSITFVGGPRDSFWGYALGTLFIRFFGIFLVLSLLMVGMIFSGAIFSRLESRKTSLEPDGIEPDDIESEPVSNTQIQDSQDDTQAVEEDVESDEYTEEWADVDYETAAAIAVALHLHFSQPESGDNTSLDTDGSAGFTSSTGSASSSTRSTGSRPLSQNQNSWSNQGRDQMMRDRMQTYNRGSR